MRRKLQRDDVVGQRIESVWQIEGATGEDDWLDTASGWLVLENGLAISLPTSDTDPWSSEVVPDDARLLEGGEPDGWWARVTGVFSKLFGREDSRSAYALVGSHIGEVYRLCQDGEAVPGESVIMELEDGKVVTFCACAPSGTGAVGFAVNAELVLDEEENETVTAFFGA